MTTSDGAAPAESNRPAQQVVIVQRRLTHYRVPLFEAMREQLDRQGIRLRVLHGRPTESEASKRDEGSLAWAETLATRYWMDGRICWQPFAARTAGADLVVLTHENKLVNNLGPMLNPWRRQRLAFWGHGGNLQAVSPDSVPERFKRWTARRADWWFAYTQLSADQVMRSGFAPERITVLNNSIDTAALAADIALARAAGRPALRAALGLATHGPLGIFLGSLYPEKRLAWLLDAADRIADAVPGFQLAVAGAGPDEPVVRRAAATRAHVRYLGPVSGRQKANLLAAADLMLGPGAIGLGVLDALVAGLPLVSTACRSHGPEICYLEHGRNGWITADDPAGYVSACVRLLRDADLAAALGDAARQDADRYSIAAMTERFCTGIEQCLQAPRRRS